MTMNHTMALIGMMAGRPPDLSNEPEVIQRLGAVLWEDDVILIPDGPGRYDVACVDDGGLRQVKVCVTYPLPGDPSLQIGEEKFFASIRSCVRQERTEMMETVRKMREAQEGTRDEQPG